MIKNSIFKAVLATLATLASLNANAKESPSLFAKNTSVLMQDVSCDKAGCTLHMLTLDLSRTRIISVNAKIPREWVELRF